MVFNITHMFNKSEQDLFIEHKNFDWYLKQTLIKKLFYKNIFL